MKLCDNCPKQWDCYEPCPEVINWKEMKGRKDRIPDRAYKPKGIAMMLSNAERKRLKSSWDNANENSDNLDTSIMSINNND